ncbi:MAG: hypothetical protein ACR2OU_20890 [Thermomicrobiales bacterium]
MLSPLSLAEPEELNRRVQRYGETSIRANRILSDILEPLIVVHRVAGGCASAELSAWARTQLWSCHESTEDVARFFAETAETVLRTLRLTDKLPVRQMRPEFPGTQPGVERHVPIPA